MNCLVRLLPTLLAGVLAAPVASGQALRLEQALALAQQHNHDLRLAAIATDNAAAAVTSAAAAPNPVLTLQTMNINPAAGIGSGNLRSKTVDSAVRIDQLIERGGKRQLRTAAAELQRDAAQADLADTRRQLKRDVSAAYYDLLAAQERAAITRDAAELASHALDAAEMRRRAGDLAGSDTARLRVDALHARNDADDADANLDDFRRALALLLGVDAPDRLSAIDAWPAVHLDADAATNANVEARPDVAAARARASAALASRDLSVAGRTRDVTVGMQFEHYPVSTANPQGTGNSVGVAVQIPLFVHYGMQGEIRSAEAALDAANETLEKTRQSARADVGHARAQLSAASARVARYENEILPAARKALDAGEFAFARGAMSIMDVLDVRRAWRTAQLEAVAAHAEMAKSLASLNAALSREHPQ